MAFTPAKAADLGGDCCADLEERVAELEATTVRKGNRVVSVQLYGQVNKALLVWDDGVDSDLYVVDNDYSGTRMGLRGKGNIEPGWDAGYRIEFQFNDAALSSVSQNTDEGEDAGTFDFRIFDTYIESEQFGRFSLGQGDTASNGITEINLGGAPVDSSWSGTVNFSFFIRGTSVNNTRGVSPGVQGITWGNVISNQDGLSRQDRIRYDTPTLYGFILSTSWGDNDVGDIALRYSNEWNSIRFAAGAAYWYNGQGNDFVDGGPAIEGYGGSASIQHTPSGLYLSGAYSQQDFDDYTTSSTFCPGSGDELVGNECIVDDADGTDTGPEDETVDALSATSPVFNQDQKFWYVQGGVTKNWTGYGATTFYADYAEAKDFGFGAFTALDAAHQPDDVLVDSKVEKYGIGFNQDFDSAATQIYILADWYEADLDFEDRVADDDGDGDTDDGNADDADASPDDWFSVTAGMRIRF
jgi:hypothetical protein